MSLLRVGDIIRVWERHDPDLCMLTGPSVGGWPWPATVFPIGFKDSDDPADRAPFLHHIPADFAERAAVEGRIIYPADSWSCWPLV